MIQRRDRTRKENTLHSCLFNLSLRLSPVSPKIILSFVYGIWISGSLCPYLIEVMRIVRPRYKGYVLRFSLPLPLFFLVQEPSKSVYMNPVENAEHGLLILIPILEVANDTRSAWAFRVGIQRTSGGGSENRRTPLRRNEGTPVAARCCKRFKFFNNMCPASREM